MRYYCLPRSESCINNVKLTLNCTRDYPTSRSSHPYVNNSTYTKRPRNRLSRASLDNVSIDPWGDSYDGDSTLRRTRSLALSREDLFSSLEYLDGRTRRRSQLIPRAKLVDKSSIRFNRTKGFSVDNLHTYEKTKPRRRSSLNPPSKSSHSPEGSKAPDPEKNSDSPQRKPSPSDLTLPNYYPDDTDNTDIVSLTDNISSVSLDNLSKAKCPSLDDIKWEPYESIPYDENIVLSTNKDLYDTIRPKKLRNPTPYHENYGKINPNPNPQEEEEELKSLEQTDTNLDEIRLSNENISRIEVEPSVEENPVYESGPLKIEVKTEEDPDQYKTIVEVESQQAPQTPPRRDSKSHSHSYLKEFLESQKGSKRPLQNFIAKKISNLSRKQSKEPTNLTDNQFHSLPDITISKNLRRCEKIDKKLRRCDNSENRFIVNIGRHFDITTPPVDFELKIAKVPKKGDKRPKQSDEELIRAVRELKETLHGSQLSLDENHNIKDDNMALLYCKDECEKEFREKLGTMRDYWKKLVGEEETTKCKIVDVKTKAEDKSQSKVQLAKQVFEPKPEKTGKISPTIKETCQYFESKEADNERTYESLCPTSVEIIDSATVEHKPLTKSQSVIASSQPEFDHVRYRVVKSDVFQKKIFANCDKESQFDDLIQYLQDYSFQELLIDNNIVIIEPIRSKVPYEPSVRAKTMRNVTQKIHRPEGTAKSNLNRHFFYHPIRVNKEVNDEELPNPDTVRQVRQFFEGGSTTTTKQDKEKNNSTSESDPDKDRCSATDSTSPHSNLSDFDGQENLYDSIDNEIYCEYVSEDILEKIRECGTTVTYYGGRVVNHKTGQPVLTKVIMEEIKNNEERCLDCKNCKRTEKQDESKDNNYLGVKFRILKSNSCNSRLQIGVADNKDLDKDKDKNAINETIKKHSSNQPKIIAEEMKKEEGTKLTQWKDVSNEKNYAYINFNENNSQKINDFYHYEKVKNGKKRDDIEFEPYEVA